MPPMLVSMLSQMKNQSVESTANAVSVKYGSIPASQRDLLSLFSSGLSQNNVSVGQSFQTPDTTELTSTKFNCSIENSGACHTVESSKLAAFDKTIDGCVGVKDGFSKYFGSTSDSTDQKLERCLHCNAPLSLGCLEQRMVLAVAEAEKRMEKHLTDSIGELERKLTERLDTLLLCLRPTFTSNSDRLSQRIEDKGPKLD